MSMMAVGAADYSRAIDGLSLSQAKLLLSLQGVDAEQQKSLLLQAGLISSSEQMQAKHVAQALTTTTLETSEKNRILTKLGLIDAETGEILTSQTCTKEKLLEALATTTLDEEEKQELVTKILGTTANGSYAISFKVLTGAIWENIKALAKWMVTNPVGQIGLTIAAIGLLRKGYDSIITSKERLADTKLEGLDDEISNLDAEIQSLETLQGKLKDGKGDKAELAQIQNELNDAIGDTPGLLNGEGKAYDVANAKLKAYIESKKQERDAAKQNKIDASKEKFDNNAYENDGWFAFDMSAEKMREQAKIYQGLVDYFNNLPDDSEIRDKFKDADEYAQKTMAFTASSGSNADFDAKGWADYWEEQVKVAYDAFDDVIEDYEGYGGQDFLKNMIANMVRGGADFTEISNAVQAVMDNEQMQEAINTYWESLVNPDIDSEKALENVKKAFDEIIKLYPGLEGFFDGVYERIISGGNKVADSTEENADKMTVSLSDLEGTSDKIGKLSSAFKELSDDGYITFKTLGEIKEATGLADDEWEQYQTKLMNAKAGSAEFNQVMTDLTYKILDNTFAGKDLTDVTEDQIASVLRECGVTNDAAIAHDYLTKKKAEEKAATIAAQMAEGKFTGELATMAKQCGVSTSALATMILKQMQLQNAKLNLSQQIGELNRYINTFSTALNIDTSKFGTTKSGNMVLTRQQLLDMGVTIKKGTTRKEGFSYKGKWYNSYNEIQSIVMPDYLYGQINTNDTPPIVRYSGSSGGSSGGSSSGSYKNEALDKYLEDAEKRYKVHQDETKYINDLNYALNNLVKTDEERLEILDKIEDARKDYADNRIKDLEHEKKMLKNMYGDNYDTSYIDKSIQQIHHEEAERLRALGYDDNSDEIQEHQSGWWDKQNELLDNMSLQYENRIKDIEHARDMFLEQNPLGDPTSFYKQLQEEYHKEAERLRALDPEKYKEEIQELQSLWWDAQNSIVDWRWDNSNNWIDQRNAYNDWALFGDSEIQAWERVVKWLKEEYPNDLEKIKEAEQSLFEARKKEFNKANDFGSSYIDSKKTLLQSYYDVTNSIAEAQHEINKELETSKTMYERLDEDTRKLLFNQEDYNVLSEELYDIQYKADKLQRQYKRDLENSTLNTIEEITSNYQMQYETLMKSYEIAKADLEVAKKKQKLNNALNERNVRMFINGQWQWVANTEDVINAKSELADAEYARRVEESGLVQQESINNLTKQQDELGVVIKNFENGVIDLDEAIRQAVKAIGSMPNALMSMYDGIVSGASESVPASGSSGSSKYDGIADAYKSNDYAAGIDSALAKGDLNAALTANKIRNDKIDYLGLNADKWSDDDIKKRFNAHASGTRYTPGGLTKLGEEGFEAFISSNGHLIPINQPTIGDIGSGGIVFNQDQMKNLRSLWDLSNINFGNSSFTNNIQPQQVSHTQDNRIIINGLTVDSGSTDGQALISALRRYIGNH